MSDQARQERSNSIGSQFAGMNVELPSAELSSRRTGMSFQRTRLSADRTLMSVVRTSLSLIGFGFTISSFFRALQFALPEAMPVNTARDFGMALVALGAGMLILEFGYQLRFMSQLRAERTQMIHEHLVHGQLGYPVSLTLISATILLLSGLLQFSAW